jgi:excisionase family DNA binding protein
MTVTTTIITVVKIAGKEEKQMREAAGLEPRMIRIAEAASYLGMSPRQLRRMVRAGEISFTKAILGKGGPWLFDRMELDRWIARNSLRLGRASIRRAS